MNKEELIIKDMKLWLKYLKPHITNKKVLDIGCGTAIGANFLRKECNAKYSLLDFENLRNIKSLNMPFKLGL